MASTVSGLLAHRAFAAACAAILCGCGGGGGTQPLAQPQNARPVPQSDLQIAGLLYADSARTPADFYAEPASVSSYTATFHIRNSDIATVVAPQDPTFELCTDDWNQALAWSETVALAQPVYSDLSATDSNEHFYEFVRTPRSSSLGPQQMRVYRCDFLDRLGVDLRHATTAAGHVNKRPIAATDLKWIAEYLWRFSSYNNVDNIVLKSAAVAGVSDQTHELTLARLVRGAGANGCDRVRVFAWRYSAAPDSGLLVSTQTDLWTFDARSDSGNTQLCGH
jgi:hypothetical protein